MNNAIIRLVARTERAMSTKDPQGISRGSWHRLPGRNKGEAVMASELFTSKQQGETVTFSYRLPKAEVHALAELAKREDRTVSNMALRIIREYLRTAGGAS